MNCVMRSGCQESASCDHAGYCLQIPRASDRKPQEAISSKERVPFNLNEYVWVQLRSRGRLELRRQHDELRRAFSKLEPYSGPVEDADGWSKWQLWTLMQYLGPLCSMGFDPPFATEIQFERPQHVETTGFGFDARAALAAADVLAHQYVFTPFHEKYWIARGGHAECTVCNPPPEKTSCVDSGDGNAT